MLRENQPGRPSLVGRNDASKKNQLEICSRYMVCSRNREHRRIMNIVIRTPVGVELEQALASKFEELLHSISWLQKWRVRRIADHADKGWDLEATLPLHGDKVVLGIQCKAELRPSAFHAFAESKSPPPKNSKLVFPVLA